MWVSEIALKDSQTVMQKPHEISRKRFLIHKAIPECVKTELRTAARGCGDSHGTPVSPLSTVTNGVAGQLSQCILLLFEVFPKPI